MLRITQGQITSLIILTLLVQIYVFAPAVMAEHVGQHLWLPLLLAIIAAVILMKMMLWIVEQFPGKSFPAVLHYLFGEFCGGVLGISYFVYFFVLFIIHAQMIVTTFKVLFLPATPMISILLLVLLLCLYCSLLGIEVLARASNMIVILLAVTLTFLALSVFPEVDLSYYQPVLPSQAKGFAYSTIVAFASYGQVFLIATLVPFVNYKNERRKHRKIFAGVVFALLLTSFIVMEEIGVFSPFELQRLQYPTVELITMIQMGEFMERMEIFLVTIWAGAILLVSGIFFSVSVKTFKQALNRNKNGKILDVILIIVGFICIVTLLPDTSSLLLFIFDQWVYWCLLFQVIFPILILITFIIRVKVRNHAAN
ncbi:GerAB/ArcD/ProY family transporter [Sediminibacillus halophilus]|uniref:Spore germination protein (Amino acid permease) n=1 Tax=Sediminibacillus halophilus TaxID=482461 RepID=A0A1G9P7E2_9BACI|nr:endospore germination permease [Sediminibacillus halophilus]SDL94659.1 spore germination protein (amino acid permease) [Sediminibacillus halophilus]